MTRKKTISLNANVVAIPVGDCEEMSEEELNKRINQMFVKYCCGGIDKPESEIPEHIKVCREIFANGYKAGYNDLLCKVTCQELEN